MKEVSLSISHDALDGPEILLLTQPQVSCITKMKATGKDMDLSLIKIQLIAFKWKKIGVAPFVGVLLGGLAAA